MVRSDAGLAIAPHRAMPEDEVSRLALREEAAAILGRNFATWAVMAPRVWAQEVRRMPDDHGATRGFSFDYAPYQGEMYDALFDPRNQEVSYQIYSRGGKSEVVLNALGYCIEQRPRRILSMWPTLGQGKKWSKDDFMGSLIEPTPSLSALIGDGAGRRKSDNTILHKLYAGGLIDIVGANAPGDLRRAKASLLYADEIDAIVEISSDEGDQLAIFKKRGSEFADTIEVYCSYPSLKRRSRIEAKLLESDFRQWFATCLHCGGEPYVMHRSQLRYDPEKPEGAHLECPRCHGLLGDAHRYKMMRAGAWKATRQFRGKAGFQANALLWPHPVDPIKWPGGFLQMLAQQEIDVEKSDNPQRSRRVLVNTVDAETFECDYEHKADHSQLYLRREKYDPRELLPEGVLFINFGADVQSDRIEIGIVGHGQKAQTWGIDHWIIKGSPLDPAFWGEVDRRLEQAAWKHPCGKYLRIDGGLIDCGYKPDEVFKFTRLTTRRRIYACRGSTQLARPIVGRPKMESRPRVRVYEIGTHEAKDVIYQRLDLDNVTAVGYKHYPAIGVFGEQYFKQLVAEDSEMKRATDGEYYRAFTCEEGVRNEVLDFEVYALAHERIMRPKYEKLARELRRRTEEEEEMKRTEGTKATDAHRAPLQQQPQPTRRFVRPLRPGGGGGFVQGWRR